MSIKDRIKVASLGKATLSSEINWIDVRVDRATELGNPFEIPKYCPPELLKVERERVIMVFRRWLWENIQLNQSNPNGRVPLDKWIQAGYIISKRFKNPTAGQVVRKLNQLWEKLEAGKKIRLLCWCAPLDCHAEVIASCLSQAESNPKLLELLRGNRYRTSAYC